ncbi:MAG: hypothetical protein IPK25_01575 [Saprospiraceae bacterium]|nr:hypothetical protein [Saprospiraceae bacterium]
MKYIVSLLWLLCWTTPFVAKSQHLNTVKNFPNDWLGRWEGELHIFSPRDTIQTIKMLVNNQPTDSINVYTWTLTYGEDTIAGKRDYVLRPVDISKGHWVVDEKNSIFLDGYVYDNTFTHVFSVMKNLLTTRMTIESNNTMTFEVMVSQDKPIRASGNGMHNGENIPEVNSYFITSYQRANLKRM